VHLGIEHILLSRNLCKSGEFSVGQKTWVCMMQMGLPITVGRPWKTFFVDLDEAERRHNSGQSGKDVEIVISS
jgi:hypothetical protein